MTQPTGATVSATANAETPRKHCWECLRRRLVCDSVRPVCNRCRTSGLVCPGYDDKQPLRWVKPGRVTVRTRRRPKAGVSVGAKQTTPDNTDVDGDVIDANIADRTRPTSKEGSSDSDLQREFDALCSLGIRQPKTPDAIMRYDIACENFAGVQASYICKSIRPVSPFLPDVSRHHTMPRSPLLIRGTDKQTPVRYTSEPRRSAYYSKTRGSSCPW